MSFLARHGVAYFLCFDRAGFTIPGADQNPVVIELVLALDSSASVDVKEFELQNEGIARAFRDPEVLQAVDNLRPFGAAIAVVQWGGPGETQVVMPFTHIENARDAKAFGFRVSLIRRWMRASSTSIATGIADAHALIESNGFEGQRKIIDVSGDGRKTAVLILKLRAIMPLLPALSSMAFPSKQKTMTFKTIT